MAINNPRYFNAAVAGIGASLAAGGISDPTAADYLAYANAVNAAATEVDSVLPAVSGGATQTAADLLGAVCQIAFLNRNLSSTVQPSYLGVANAIAALFTELLTKEIAQPGNTFTVLGIVVPAITAPNTAQVTITNALFAGANTIDATFSGPPTATQLGIQGQWVTTSSTGVIVVSFVKAANNYPGATELVLVGVRS